MVSKKKNFNLKSEIKKLENKIHKKSHKKTCKNRYNKLDGDLDGGGFFSGIKKYSKMFIPKKKASIATAKLSVKKFKATATGVRKGFLGKTIGFKKSKVMGSDGQILSKTWSRRNRGKNLIRMNYKSTTQMTRNVKYMKSRLQTKQQKLYQLENRLGHETHKFEAKYSRKLNKYTDELKNGIDKKREALMRKFPGEVNKGKVEALMVKHTTNLTKRHNIKMKKLELIKETFKNKTKFLEQKILNKNRTLKKMSDKYGARITKFEGKMKNKLDKSEALFKKGTSRSCINSGIRNCKDVLELCHKGSPNLQQVSDCMTNKGAIGFSPQDIQKNMRKPNFFAGPFKRARLRRRTAKLDSRQELSRELASVKGVHADSYKQGYAGEFKSLEKQHGSVVKDLETAPLKTPALSKETRGIENKYIGAQTQYKGQFIDRLKKNKTDETISSPLRLPFGSQVSPNLSNHGITTIPPPPPMPPPMKQQRVFRPKNPSNKGYSEWKKTKQENEIFNNQFRPFNVAAYTKKRGSSSQVLENRQLVNTSFLELKKPRNFPFLKQVP